MSRLRVFRCGGAHRFIAELAWAGVVAQTSEEQLRADYIPRGAEPEPGTFTDSIVVTVR